MDKDLKKQKQISIRPSVEDKGAKVVEMIGASSFSDMLEKLILDAYNKGSE